MAHYRCDRCGADLDGYYTHPGACTVKLYKDCGPARSPYLLDFHVCDSCLSELLRFLRWHMAPLPTPSRPHVPITSN